MFKPGGPTFLELMQQGLSGTTDGYDLLAPKFDHTPFRTPPELLDAVAEKLGGPVKSGVDFCCGTGAGMLMMRPLVTERLVGVDLSAGMLEEAERRVSAVDGPAELEFIHGDAMDQPFDQEFELATCFGAFGHILERDQPRFVQGVHKSLVPGGRFAFITGEHPTAANPMFWAYHGFNAAIRVRNRLLDPPFHMYYLNFCIPDIVPMFQHAGFDLELHEATWSRFRYIIAIAHKRVGT